MIYLSNIDNIYIYMHMCIVDDLSGAPLGMPRWDVAQRIVDVLALRPCFDLGSGGFQAPYDALIAALDEREALQRSGFRAPFKG